MKLKSFICGLFVLSAAVACDPNNLVTPELEVSKESVKLAAASAEASFTVKTNQKWTVTADASWVKLDPAYGEPSDNAVTVTVTADDNSSETARTAVVTVTAGSLSETVAVSQDGKTVVPAPEPAPDPTLEVSEEALAVEAAGGDVTFTVTTNQAWTVTVPEACDWVTCSPVEGEASEEAVTVTVTVAANEVAEERTVTVTVTAGELTETVEVTQAAAEQEQEPMPEPTPMPEIPADLVPTTLWEGTFESKFWESGIMNLSGTYDWSARKAGEYLKITCAPTDTAAEEWMVGLRNGDWQATGIFPEFFYTPEGGVVIELTQDVIDYFVANKGLIVQGNNATITKIEIYSTEAISDGTPEIPEGYEAVTLWEGSMSLSWGTAMEKLANGGYNWNNCKVGQFVKIHYVPTDPSTNWTLQLTYSDVDYAWQTIADYDNMGTLVLELTEELLGKFTSPNRGMIVHGNNITVTKVELYREPAGEAGYALTMTNETAGDGWSTQVWYELDEPMEAGAEYVFTCVVKSTVARDWCSVLLQSADGQDQNFDHGMNLFTDWTPTTITFVPDKDTYTKVTFNVGDFVGVVSIDNVSMKKVGSDVELIKNGDFENGLTTGWLSWTNAQGIGEGYVE